MRDEWLINRLMNGREMNCGARLGSFDRIVFMAACVLVTLESGGVTVVAI